MNEEQVENAAVSWFSQAGYDSAIGAELSSDEPGAAERTYGQTILEGRLAKAVRLLNRDFDEAAIRQVVLDVAREQEADLVRENRRLHRLMVGGVPVEVREPGGEARGLRAILIDFENPMANDWLVVRQLAVRQGEEARRPDLVIYLNGLPVAVIELKDPTDEQATLDVAVDQVSADYKKAVPVLFRTNVVVAASDGSETRLGSLTAGLSRFTPWRSAEDDREPGEPTLETLICGLFTPASFLDYLRHCVTFEEARDGSIAKKVAGYHQFRAVRRARASVVKALKPGGEGRGGVVWHTQGAGKSLTMLMLAGALVRDEAMGNPTVVVLTDRNDLDDQLFGTFALGRDLLMGKPEQANSCADLAEKLDRASGGVIFTTIQKFAEGRGAINKRPNVVVLADEAHRSQYGFVDGGARWMREALPNATFVGFTGTPIERDDRNTPAVFGDYIDVYDVRQAVEDGATVSIYYESRLVKLTIDESGADAADRALRQAAEAAGEGKNHEKDVPLPLKELIAAKPRIHRVAQELVEHIEKRQEAMIGKAMAVTVTRQAAIDLHDAIAELRPEWVGEGDGEGRMKVVITGDAKEGEAFEAHGRTKARREALAERFKNPTSDFDLVIVCDMWLTGFDCPSLHTMYLDKPLAGHSLMQAIARVNRVFGDKPGGLVVDFLGLMEPLADALKVYADAGGRGDPAEIQAQAVPAMQEELERLEAFFHGFNPSPFYGGEAADQVRTLTTAEEHVYSQDDGKARFLLHVARLSRAYALAVPRPETEGVRDEVAFYQAVRSRIRKRTGESTAGSDRHAASAVRQVLSGALASDEVINLFEAAGLPDANISVLSDEFLDRVVATREKHVALETLRRLLNDQVRERERVNVVQGRGFREALGEAIARYNNRAITTAEVITELIDLARTIRSAKQRGENIGLGDDEVAFYDALADNASAREVMQDDTLKLIARELAEKIRAKATLDWTRRETVRADMRRAVKRLLTKYGYPPDLQPAATKLVLQQAEVMAERTAA